MELMSTIRQRPLEFLDLCKKYKVASMSAFGSSVTTRFNPSTSDVDLLVELSITDPIEYGEALLNLWDELERFFGRKVDLLTESSIRNPYLKKSINETKKLIYDRQREKVFV